MGTDDGRPNKIRRDDMDNIMITFTSDEMEMLVFEVGMAIEQELDDVETGKTDDKEYLHKLNALYEKIYNAC